MNFVFHPDIVQRLNESGGELEREAARVIEQLRSDMKTLCEARSALTDKGYQQCQRDIRAALGIED